MNGKKRVELALSHRTPDRIPVAYNGAEPELAAKIHAFYGVPDELSLWLKLGVDFWPIDYGKYALNEAMKDRSNALAKVSTVAEIDSFFDRHQPEYDYLSMVEAEKDLHTEKFRFVGGGSIFAAGWAMRGFERLLEDFYINPELVDAVFEGLLEEHLKLLENILPRFNAQGGDRKIDMLFLGDDLGTQEDLIFSPDLYRRFVKPRLAKLAALAHAHGAVVAFHSCGSVYKMIPDLIETGIDVLNPIQTSARGMDPQTLKREFGADLTFWGGADTQTVFSRGNPASVRRHVRELKHILGENGGYICAPTHVITKDMPMENVIAFFDEAFVAD